MAILAAADPLANFANVDIILTENDARTTMNLLANNGVFANFANKVAKKSSYKVFSPPNP